jgi:hypothetical protein
MSGAGHSGACLGFDCPALELLALLFGAPAQQFNHFPVLWHCSPQQTEDLGQCPSQNRSQCESNERNGFDRLGAIVLPKSALWNRSVSASRDPILVDNADF